MTRSYFKPLLGCSLTALMAVLSSHSAHAQSAHAGAAPSDQIQEVVITAEKRTENLQKAAIAVDVLKPNEIAKEGIKNAVDLQEMLPAVKFVAADVMTVSIRGLGTTDANAGVDSAVAYSEDGIYLSHPNALSPVLFDLKSVEAVLGPQGTLYGRNSNGGAINFITNDPANKYEGMGQIGIGNYGEVDSEAMVNIPLTDDLAVRFAEGSQRHNAYNSDGSDNLDAIAGRAKLLYTPNSDLRVLLTVDASQRKSVGQTYGGACPTGITGVAACNTTHYVPWQGLLPAAQSQYNNDDTFGVSGKIDYDLGWANLTSLTGYKQYQFSGTTSAPWYGGVDNFDYVHHENDRFITQEVRLASEPNSPVKWVAGVFYSDETQPVVTQFNYYHTILQTFGLPVGYSQSFPFISTSYQSEAAFGDVTVPLPVNGLSLEGGMRYTHETKDAAGLVNSGVLGQPISPFNSSIATSNNETQSRVTWKAGVKYQFTSQNLLYADASTGFKSGGVNDLPASTGLGTYAPETVLAEEVGSKNRFLDGRLQIDASAFHYAYKGYQTYTFYAPAGGPFAGATLFPTVNSQTATFEGGELDAIARLTAVDTLKFDLNLLHDEFNTFNVLLPYAAPILRSNSEVPLAPKATYNMSYEHTFMMPNDDALSFGVNSEVVMSHLAQGNYTTDSGALGYYRQPTYHETGIDISYETAESGWTVSGYIRNIENAAVVNSVAGGYPNQGPTVNAMIDQPRTFGFSVKKVF